MTNEVVEVADVVEEITKTPEWIEKAKVVMTNDVSATVDQIIQNSPEWLGSTRDVVLVIAAKLFATIAILVIGRWVARQVQKVIRTAMTKSNIDPAVLGFACNFSYAAMMTAVVLVALGTLGVQTTSFVAIIGAAGLAVGLALQGSLSNFASGVLILILRPFKIDDYIEAGGTEGHVREFHIFTTTLTTLDNKRVIVPNSAIMEGTVTNFTAEGVRRVDLIASISYDDDIDTAKEVLAKVVSENEYVLEDPVPVIGVISMNDSSIGIAVRPWVDPVNYWDAYMSLTEAIKKCIESAGMTIPFPQRDIHFYKHES